MLSLRASLAHTQVLLSRDGTAKLGDLGMARLLADKYVQTAVVGTLAWCAPLQLPRCAGGQAPAGRHAWGSLAWAACGGLCLSAHPTALSPPLFAAPFRSAPEMLLGQRCSEKADIYSMGVVLW